MSQVNTPDRKILLSSCMTAQEFAGKWEKRWHPLREEWIVYSAHRNKRPWQGEGPKLQQPAPAYDPSCYLCPGNARVGGHRNPPYDGIYIFDNDHPVVGMNAPGVSEDDGLYRKAAAFGKARVVCYDPRHNVTLSEMAPDRVRDVFVAFREETRRLSSEEGIRSVLIFENKGEAVGVSNPHPHCQIYATDFVFKYVGEQIRISGDYKKEHGSDIFSAIIARERKDGVRVLGENEHAIAFIPFFARYAYEVMIFPKKKHATMLTLGDDEVASLALLFQQVIRRLDMNYDMSFPYVMSVLQAPLHEPAENFRMHLWLQPPFRQPGLIKYLAGPEIGAGNFMADTIPEEKAAELLKIDLSKYASQK